MSLPPLFALDDYWSCVEKGNDYCTFIGSLASTLPNNPVWNQILANKSNELIFDRSVLHRGMCIPQEYSGNLEFQKQYSQTHLSQEIGYLNLTANVEHFSCIRDAKLRIYDFAILLVITAYLLFVTAVSVLDMWVIKKKNRDALIWNFSIFHNWDKIVNGKKSRDYEKLKSMQGVRVFLMMAIIWSHTTLSYLFVYLQNPALLEKKLQGELYAVLFAFTPHMVQPFFLLSSWLCTLQIYNVYEDNGKFTFKDLLTIVVNRYFRLIPCVAYSCIFMTTEWLTMISSSPNVHFVVGVFKKGCENNILSSLLFINNYNYVQDMCNPVTWYLSADFQFYVFTAVLVYLVLKYKWSVIKVVAIAVFATCSIFGYCIYMKNLDTIFRISLSEMEFPHFLTSVRFRESYSASHASLTTPVLGMMFGFIYVKNRNRAGLHKNKTLVTLWFILSYGLFFFTLYLTTLRFNAVISAIVGPFLKPMFAASFGVLILGMSHNIGGIAKKIMESRFLEIVGQFCFGAYIMHICFSFSRGILEFTPYNASRLEVDYVFDWTCSFASGAFLCLVLEHPASVIQKKILPQIKKKTQVERELEHSDQNGVILSEKLKSN